MLGHDALLAASKHVQEEEFAFVCLATRFITKYDTQSENKFTVRIFRVIYIFCSRIVYI